MRASRMNGMKDSSPTDQTGIDVHQIWRRTPAPDLLRAASMAVGARGGADWVTAGECMATITITRNGSGLQAKLGRDVLVRRARADLVVDGEWLGLAPSSRSRKRFVRRRRTMRWPGRGVLAVLVMAVAAGVVVAALWISGTFSGGSGPAVRARVYANVDACLLTGSRGLSDPAAAPVWAGMEDASLSTRARVSYLSVPGQATEANALPVLGSLLVMGCKVIVAEGDPERAAVLADAPRFPAVKFVVFGAGTAPSNVTVLAFQPARVRSSVSGVVSAAVR
jgi:hypothetical protein